MRTHHHSLGLWLNDAELAHLKQQCQVTGLNANAYIRKLILGENLRPRPPDEYAALLRELSAIGNNVNQIAHWANAREGISKSEIHEAATLVDKAWRLVRESL